MLVLASDKPMSYVQVFGCLFKGHRLYIPTDLIVIVAHTDRSLPEDHVYALCYTPRALILEKVVDGENDLSLGEIDHAGLWLRQTEVDNIACAILKPQDQAAPTLFAMVEIGFADQTLCVHAPRL